MCVVKKKKKKDKKEQVLGTLLLFLLYIINNTRSTKYCKLCILKVNKNILQPSAYLWWYKSIFLYPIFFNYFFVHKFKLKHLRFFTRYFKTEDERGARILLFLPPDPPPPSRQVYFILLLFVDTVNCIAHPRWPDSS